MDLTMLGPGLSLHYLRSEKDIGGEGLGRKPIVLFFTLILDRRKSIGFGVRQTCVQILALSLGSCIA